MKKNDIIIIVIVAFISAIAAYFLANLLFGGEKKFTLTAPVVTPISSDFAAPMPDDQFINKDSINTTKNIYIGETTNNDPFKQ